MYVDVQSNKRHILLLKQTTGAFDGARTHTNVDTWFKKKLIKMKE